MERVRRVRVEIQALRAVAVLLVLLYHVWPAVVPGGYVGVDVFFVISGYLITAHLAREAANTGRISLSRFWARRARRLLPASLLVLFVTAIATLLIAPDTYWRQFMTEIAGSALYVENWQLAGNAVNYLAAGNSASPVQHFWSLSAEEQFYLIWPVLILACALLTRHRRVVARRRALAATLTAVVAVSFLTSVVWTALSPASAYFVTPTRIWEFAAGGLLAVLGIAVPERSPVAVWLSWAGVATIVVSTVALNASTPFPGAAALLPVLGTLAVIAAGNPEHRWSPIRAADHRPVQLLGDISYSVYLWHFPLIVFLPMIAHRSLGFGGGVTVLVLTFGLGYLTKRYVEDPFRFSPRLTKARPLWTFVAMAVTASLLVGVSTCTVMIMNARNDDEADRVSEATTGECFGAAALDPQNDCPDPFTAVGAMTPAFAMTDTNLVADPGGGWECEVPRGESTIRRCVLGETDDPVRTIAMFGDSHAMHMMEALRVIAEENHWQVITYFKSACSGTGAADVLLEDRPDDQAACAEWGAAVLTEIAANPLIDTVVTANVSSAYYQDDGSEPIGPERYEAAWRPLLDAGKAVVAIADVPRTTGGKSIPNCLAEAGEDNPDACTTSIATAIFPDAMTQAARKMKGDGVLLLDLTRFFCVDEVCHPRIGQVIVYSDASHLTNTYARTLAPFIEPTLIATGTD